MLWVKLIREHDSGANSGNYQPTDADRASYFGVYFNYDEFLAADDFSSYGSQCRIIFRHKACRYLTEFMSETDINGWDSSRPVFISAPTGAGKSRFVMNDLLGYVIRERERYDSKSKILLLSNRIALDAQLRKTVAEIIKYHISNGNDFKMLEKMLKANAAEVHRDVFDFEMISVCSYHRLQSDGLDLSCYSHIVVDEAHYFTSDATFNEFTRMTMKYIIENGKNAVRIYMSATPEIVFEPLVRKEYREYKKKGNDEPLDVLYYDMARDYSYIRSVCSYEKYEELATAIEASSERWLIFVGTIKAGSELKAKLSRTCVLVSAENKYRGDSKAAFESLVQKETFDAEVLICTAVIDNGVNVVANHVQNVAIDVFDRTEFIQMLGRARRDDQTQLNLYIRSFGLDDLRKKLQRQKEKIADRLMTIIRKSNDDFWIAKEGHLYHCNQEKCNKNELYQRFDSANRLERLLALGQTYEVQLQSFKPRADYSAIHKHFIGCDRKERVRASKSPWGYDALRLFAPPPIFSWEQVETVDIKGTSFLNIVLGEMIPQSFVDNGKGESDDAVQFYRYLANDSLYNTPLAETLRWIGKAVGDCRTVSELMASSGGSLDTGKSYEVYVATEEEIEAHHNIYRGKKTTYIERAYLEAHGIESGSAEEAHFIDAYLQGHTELFGTGKEINIPGGGKFLIKSYRAPGDGHTTFYLLIPVGEKSQ